MATTASTAPEVVYAPGACNIAHDEVVYRRKAGYLGVAIAVALTALLFLLGSPFWTLLFVAFPTFLAAIGFIQARENFCVRYAAESRFNVDHGYDNRGEVSDEADHKADMAKARKLNLQAGGIAIGVGVVLAVIAALVG
jgi:hypothetical protein